MNGRIWRWLPLLLWAACLVPAHPASAQDAAGLSLPGLEADADRLQDALRRPFPAGGTEVVRARAAEAAQAAQAAQNWAQALPALQTLIGTTPRDATADAATWLGLARAELGIAPPDPARALQAGWKAYTLVDDAQPTANAARLRALRVMAQAAAALDQPLPELRLLQAIALRAPNDAAAQQAFAQRQQALGLLFTDVTTDAEAFPARACLGFFGEPSSAPDFHPADWVALQPPRPDAAVTLESHRLCVTGLPPGATTTVTLRRGLPGNGGLALKAELPVRVAMPDRQPRLVFQAGRYLQPRGSDATVALDVVNLSAVHLRLVRIDERNLLAVMAAHPPGQPIDADGAIDIATSQGRVVWTGSAAVPGFTRNALLHVVLPLPPAMGPPGLYALLANPGDGTPFAEGEAPAAVQMVLRTDLAPTVWRGADGATVQLRSYASGLPVAGAVVDLLAADNEVLAHAETDADGLVRFAAPLLAGQNAVAPAALHVRAGTGAAADFTRIDLTAPDFDLSDRGVAGTPQPGPLDPFLWTDRGIYRPGETIHVMALLRDAAGAPAARPVHLVVTRPDGRVFQDTVPPLLGGASLRADVALSAGAARGSWRIAVRAEPDGPALGQVSVQVDAFVPPRLAVAFAAPPAALPPGRTTPLGVDVRFLYGAPGSGLSGTGSVTLTPDPAPFAALRDYRFGLADEAFTARELAANPADTDALGHTTLPVDLSALPDVSTALRATASVTINDPAGRGVTATTSVKVRPAAPLIGIREAFADGAVNAGAEAGFALLAVDPDGKRVAMPVQLRLVRQIPDWRLAVANGQARYETVWRDEPVDAQALTLPAEGPPLRYARPLPFGRYKLEVLQAQGGLAASSVVFFSGWAVGDDPDVPARVAVRSDHRLYRPGDTAHLHVEAPFAGPATVLVMTDRVHRVIDLPAAGSSFDVDVPVTADWGAGAYVGVHVFRPATSAAGLGGPAAGLGGPAAGPTGTPDRAIGLDWIGLDPAPRTLPLALAPLPVQRPRGPMDVAVQAAPGAWVSLAAVDEGVLSLTGFRTPDPLGHFFGQRTLGVGIHDDWARLLRPAGAANTLLRQGAGADASSAAPPIPQRVVSLFAGPVQAGPDGVAHVRLDLPDFEGELRLMAVGWDGTRTAAASAAVTVRDPLVVEALLPRFLAPGDSAEAGVLLQNLELPPGPVSLHLAASGALALAGEDPAPVTLAAQARATVPLSLRAGSAGPGELVVEASGPGGFHVVHRLTLDVHPARGTTTTVTPVTLAAGATATLVPSASGFIPGSWSATAGLGTSVRYDPAALVRALAAYPLNCLEQLTSRGLPLAMLPDAAAGPDRAGQLQRATEAVLDRQRFDGGFGLWSATGEAQPWLSAYATDFLLRARAAGAPVPDTAMDAALGWLAGTVATPPNGPEDHAAQAYALYVLALAGRAPAGAIRVAAADLDAEPSPLARAQLAAAEARLGDADRARAIFAAVLQAPARETWPGDYGSALRDATATAVLAQESGVMAAALPALRASLPGSDLDPARLSTQEQAWAAAAAAAMGAGGPPVRLSADGHAVPPASSVTLKLTGPLTLRNDGSTPLAGSLVVTGVPSVAPPPLRAGMQVRRNFFALDGSPLVPDKLARNTVFVMLVEGGATDGQDHQAMLLAGLPAGWEIAGRFPAGTVDAMPWLGSLSDTDSQAAADDRFAAALTLTLGDGDDASFRLAVLLRAVTPGEFEYPGMVLSDMYRPAVLARQGATRVTVLPAP